MADDSTRTTTIQAVVPIDVAAELRAKADAERRSLSSVCRIALEDALRPETSRAPSWPSRGRLADADAGRPG